MAIATPEGASRASQDGTFTARAEDLDLWISVRIHDGRVADVRLDDDRPEDARDEDHPLLDRILAHLRTGDDAFADVPVDLSAVTLFQRRVLQALRDVPPGETVTYGELAKRVGRPGAARAVGQAMHANPVPLVVPCHRVVAADGGLGGYSGGRGVGTKQALLGIEGAR